MGVVASTADPEESTERSFHDFYEIGRQIGKGSQGIVYDCKHCQTGKPLAVKVLDRTSRSTWQTYQREVELARFANSWHVITVLEEFADSASCYVVMEKFAGHLRKGLKWTFHELGCKTLGDSCLRSLMRQGLSAIAYLHEQSVAHRDVKANNLLLDSLDLRSVGFRVVLTDLGLAKRHDPRRYLCTRVGTRKYWSPEVYDRRYWHSVDLFALGVTLFLAATFEYPFLDEQSTRSRDLSLDGAVPETLSPKARDLLSQLLSKDPHLRPSAAEAQCHAWLWDEKEVVAVITEEDDVNLRPEETPDRPRLRLPPATLEDAEHFRATTDQALLLADPEAMEAEEFFVTQVNPIPQCGRVMAEFSCGLCGPKVPYKKSSSVRGMAPPSTQQMAPPSTQQYHQRPPARRRRSNKDGEKMVSTVVEFINEKDSARMTETGERLLSFRTPLLSASGEHPCREPLSGQTPTHGRRPDDGTGKLAPVLLDDPLHEYGETSCEKEDGYSEVGLESI